MSRHAAAGGCFVESFPADKISALANFHSLFYYYGIACEQMP